MNAITSDNTTLKATPVREDNKLCSEALMLFLAFVAGIFGGFGAIVFKAIIGFFRNFSFYGTFDLNMDPNVYIKASSWGALIIFVPVVASLLVTAIIRRFAPEARGHGVPEVLNAIYYREGRIRPSIVLAKAIVSAISIGTGGSIGREGPIVQIGSAFGSMLGQIIKMPTRQRNILIAAGSAAGVAATFNAPIGGLCFAVELLMVSISARTITLVAVATVTATYIGRVYNGLAPSFDVQELALFEDHATRFYTILFCVPLGVLAGLASAFFIRSIYFVEDYLKDKIKNDYLRHASGMLGIGIILYMFMLFSGHYYVGGVGYATVVDTLNGSIFNPWFLALLFILKLIATSVTIGSGASGGVFSPSLFLGATLGAAFGNFIAWSFPSLTISPALYTIVGMAAMVGGTTGAVLTAIIMTFEQTRDYGVILPIIITVSIAHIVRMRLCSESIYTLKLSRRGTHVPQGLQAAVSAGTNAKHVMSKDFKVIDVKELHDWLEQHVPGKDPLYTLIKDGIDIIGVVREDLLYMMRDQKEEKIIDNNISFVIETTRWAVILRAMRFKSSEISLVTQYNGSRNEHHIVGVITSRELMQHAGNDAQLMD